MLSSAGDRWKVVFFHEPIYTHGKHEEAVRVRETILAILDRRHVNLVLCGHDHLYERTHPLRAGRIVEPGEGTVYVTTGAGGAGLYQVRPRPPDYLAGWEDTLHGFTVVDVSADILHVRQVAGGRYIDDCYIPRPRTPTTTPLALR